MQFWRDSTSLYSSKYIVSHLHVYRLQPSFERQHLVPLHLPTKFCSTFSRSYNSPLVSKLHALLQVAWYMLRSLQCYLLSETVFCVGLSCNGMLTVSSNARNVSGFHGSASYQMSLQESIAKCKISKRQETLNRACEVSHFHSRGYEGYRLLEGDTMQSNRNATFGRTIQLLSILISMTCSIFIHLLVNKAPDTQEEGGEIRFSLKMGPHGHNSGGTVWLKGCTHLFVLAFSLEVKMVPLLLFKEITGACIWQEFAHPDFNLTPDSAFNYHAIHCATITQQALDNGLW